MNERNYKINNRFEALGKRAQEIIRLVIDRLNVSSLKSIATQRTREHKPEKKRAGTESPVSKSAAATTLNVSCLF